MARRFIERLSIVSNCRQFGQSMLECGGWHRPQIKVWLLSYTLHTPAAPQHSKLIQFIKRKFASEFHFQFFHYHFLHSTGKLTIQCVCLNVHSLRSTSSFPIVFKFPLAILCFKITLLLNLQTQRRAMKMTFKISQTEKTHNRIEKGLAVIVTRAQQKKLLPRMQNYWRRAFGPKQ